MLENDKNSLIKRTSKSFEERQTMYKIETQNVSRKKSIFRRDFLNHFKQTEHFRLNILIAFTKTLRKDLADLIFHFDESNSWIELNESNLDAKDSIGVVNNFEALIDFSQPPEKTMNQWTELLHHAMLNESDINAYWLEFDPIGKLEGVLFGTFLIAIAIGAFVGNFIIAIHSFR